MKIRTLTIISVIFILVIALTFTAFSRGRANNAIKIQLDANTYKKVEPSIKNLYESLKNLVNKEVSAGIISKYYAESILKNLDEAYSLVSKTKTLYLPFFGAMGLRGPKGQPPFGGQGNPPVGQGPQNNQGGQSGNPPPSSPGIGQGFGQMAQSQLTEQQLQALKSITPEVLKVIEAESNFGKTLKDNGIITDLQLSSYLQRLESIKQNINQFPLVHYGLMQFFMLTGYNYNN